jgi:hypothetical protein
MSAEVETFSGGEEGEEHLKGDGTLDMRYNFSKETVAEMAGEEGISGMSESSYTFEFFAFLRKPKDFLIS